MKRNRPVAMPASPDRSLAEIKAIMAQNRKAGLREGEGLTSSEIGRHSRALMFGENDEAFPDPDTWSSIVD